MPLKNLRIAAIGTHFLNRLIESIGNLLVLRVFAADQNMQAVLT